MPTDTQHSHSHEQQQMDAVVIQASGPPAQSLAYRSEPVPELRSDPHTPAVPLGVVRVPASSVAGPTVRTQAWQGSKPGKIWPQITFRAAGPTLTT